MAPITVKPSEEKWSIRCCFFCNGPLLGEERILKCMHFICKTCLGVRKIDSSVYCLCNVITTKDFIDVNCPLRILTKPGMCSFHTNCMNEATTKCRTCKTFFCDDCGKRHVNVEHGDNLLNRLMDFNLGKKYSVTCNVCTNSEAKTYCIECSKELCSGCSMHCYLVHTQENIDTLSKKSKLELLKTKSDLKQVIKNVIDCTEQTKDHYKILEVQKQEAYTVIEQKVEEAYKQIEDLRHLLKQSVDDYVLKCSEEVGECQMRFKDLKLKSNYYINLTEHILKDLPSHKCYKLSVIFKDKLINAENSFERIFKEISQINICFGIKWEKNDLKDFFDHSIVKCLVNDEKLKISMSRQRLDFNTYGTTFMPMNQEQCDDSTSDSQNDTSSSNSVVEKINEAEVPTPIVISSGIKFVNKSEKQPSTSEKTKKSSSEVPSKSTTKNTNGSKILPSVLGSLMTKLRPKYQNQARSSGSLDSVPETVPNTAAKNDNGSKHLTPISFKSIINAVNEIQSPEVCSIISKNTVRYLPNGSAHDRNHKYQIENLKSILQANKEETKSQGISKLSNVTEVSSKKKIQKSVAFNSDENNKIEDTISESLSTSSNNDNEESFQENQMQSDSSDKEVQLVVHSKLNVEKNHLHKILKPSTTSSIKKRKEEICRNIRFQDHIIDVSTDETVTTSNSDGNNENGNTTSNSDNENNFSGDQIRSEQSNKKVQPDADSQLAIKNDYKNNTVIPKESASSILKSLNNQHQFNSLTNENQMIIDDSSLDYTTCNELTNEFISIVSGDMIMLEDIKFQDISDITDDLDDDVQGALAFKTNVQKNDHNISSSSNSISSISKNVDKSLCIQKSANSKNKAEITGTSKVDVKNANKNIPATPNSIQENVAVLDKTKKEHKVLTKKVQNDCVSKSVTTKTLGSKSSVTKSYALNINNKKTVNLTIKPGKSKNTAGTATTHNPAFKKKVHAILSTSSGSSSSSNQSLNSMFDSIISSDYILLDVNSNEENSSTDDVKTEIKSDLPLKNISKVHRNAAALGINKKSFMCSCCKRWRPELLLKCVACRRHYHPSCHVPTVCPDSTHGPICLANAAKWKCTLCEDLNIYPRTLHRVTRSGDEYFGHSERMIVYRILLKLLCKNTDRNLVDCPSRKYHPVYYNIVTDSVSLNDIKSRASNYGRYRCTSDFIKDLNIVFLNAKLYYSQQDPLYQQVCQLQLYADKLLAEWLSKTFEECDQ